MFLEVLKNQNFQKNKKIKILKRLKKNQNSQKKFKI